jgi:large subunit ribosomal protein L4
MHKARYYKADGKKGKARALPDSLFDGVVNESAMHQVVKAYLSNQRQGTASAKSRGQVRGGGRKPWRQKGTGRARQGTIRAVQWAGGGVAFPPIPHSWRERVPKKVKSLARRSALNDRAENNRVVMVDMPALERPRTKDLLEFLGAIEADGKVLVLTDGKNDNVYLSSRNLSNVQVMAFGNESVYDVLWARTVIIERSALEEAKPKKKAKAKAKAPVVEKTAAEEPVAEAETAADQTEEETDEKKEGDDA